MSNGTEWLKQDDGTYYGVRMDGRTMPLGSLPAGWEPGTNRPAWMPSQAKEGGMGPWTIPLTLGALAIVGGALYYYYGPER